ncbi:MAG: hypothetical protein ACQEXV_05580 [Bacillota bacterium]
MKLQTRLNLNGILQLYTQEACNIIIDEYNIETKYYTPYQFLYISLKLLDNVTWIDEPSIYRFLSDFYLDDQVEKYIRELKEVLKNLAIQTEIIAS